FSFVSAKIHASIDGEVKSILRIVNPVTSGIISAVEIVSEEIEEGIISNNQLDDEKNQQVQQVNQEPHHKQVNQQPHQPPSQINNQTVSQSGSLSGRQSGSQENKYEDYEGKYKEYLKTVEKLEPKEFIEKIKEAGIVGLGGATFPTHVKLSVPKDKIVDTVILNGCECEPYITADHRLMIEYGFEMLIGALIIFKIINPAGLIIAIEDNKEDAAKSLEQKIFALGLQEKFKLVLLPSKYPMGAEKTLIKNILKRKVPVGGLPFDVGVVVQNVATAKAIFDAVILNKPLIERVVTITGDIEHPLNLMVKIGTLLTDMAEYFGKIGDKKYKVIFGGPMTGFTIGNINFPLTKGTGCILLEKVSPRSESNCIRCSRCVSICPMNLEPLMYVNFVKNNKYEDCSSYYIESCIECGSCAYICPASIPIVGYIKTGKAVLSRK
ncbi:MAG: electron transport complex subunit RsxC, partial [Actinobacteria bacterium]|nr:electron transport complex subunit RsxC [Actinomycetota bacterium]